MFDGIAVRAASLIFIIVLAFLRTPEILLEGRFWAEGAAYYFLQTYERGFGAVIFTTFQGYYSLFNWLISGLAVQFPLEQAPLVNVYASLLVMLTPSAFILFLPNVLGLQGWRRCLLAVCMAFPLFNQLTWLTLINCQFWLGLGAAILLFVDTAERRARLIAVPYLILAVLTGVLTSFLAPFFLARLLILKDRSFLLPAVSVALGAAVQAVLVLHFLSQTPDPGSYFHPWEQAYALFVRLMTMPFLGGHILDVWDAAAGGDTPRLLWFFLSSLGVFLFLLWHGFHTYKKMGLAVLAILFFATGLSIFGSMSTTEDPLAIYLHPLAEGRYFIIASGLLCLLLLMKGAGKYSRITNGVSLLLFCFQINSAVLTYANWRQGGPSWQDEIAAWRENHERVVTVWPGGIWIISLDPEKQRWR